jgi:GTPase SAR1 family protein
LGSHDDVFSVGERQSFDGLQHWVDELNTHAEQGVGVIVCGNKTDLQSWKVDQMDAEKWANDKRYTIMFTSAKTGENVDRLIEHAATQFLMPIRPERLTPVPRTITMTSHPDRSCC